MKAAVVALWVGLLAAVSVPAARARDLPRTAPLGSFIGVSEIVASSSHDQITPDAVRERVSARVRRYSLLAPDLGDEGALLVVSVAGQHDHSKSGCVYTTYTVTVSLMEPAVLEREPGQTLLATTWHATARSMGFDREIAPEGILDLVDDLVGRFARQVQAARSKEK